MNKPIGVEAYDLMYEALEDSMDKLGDAMIGKVNEGLKKMLLETEVWRTI